MEELMLDTGTRVAVDLVGRVLTVATITSTHMEENMENLDVWELVRQSSVVVLVGVGVAIDVVGVTDLEVEVEEGREDEGGGEEG